MKFIQLMKAFSILSVVAFATACNGPSQTDLGSLTGVSPETAVATTGGGSGGSSTTTFQKLSGDYQSATVGSPAALPFNVVLKKADGTANPGKTI